MLPSLNKKTEPATSVTPAWHPNFRNYERLPDTKVVRTAFFINGLAVFIAAVIILLFLYQEYNRSTVAREIADWEQQIAREREASAAAVADFKKFQAEEKKIQEVANFLERKVLPSAMLLRLAETLPPGFILEYFDLREMGVTLRAGVRGTPEEASGLASAYVAQLQADPEIGPKFASVTLTSLSRNPQASQLNLEVQLKLAPPPPPPSAKGRKK
jgi:hypothetical protein